MRMPLLIALAAACGSSSPSPHDPAACDTTTWGAGVAGRTCDVACRSNPFPSGTAGAPSCTSMAIDGLPSEQCYSFVYDAMDGCCIGVPGGSGRAYVWSPCQ